MRYVGLKADKAGESHFEQVTLDLNEADYRPPAPTLFVSHGYQPTACNERSVLATAC